MGDFLVLTPNYIYIFIYLCILYEHSQDSKQISDHFLEPVIPLRAMRREIRKLLNIKLSLSVCLSVCMYVYIIYFFIYPFFASLLFWVLSGSCQSVRQLHCGWFSKVLPDMYTVVSFPFLSFFIYRRCVDNFIINLILFHRSFVNTTLELY